MRSDKHYDKQNQRRFRCFIHSQDAIQCRHLQENATKSAWTIWRVYLKITEPFNEQSVNTDTIGAENDAGCHTEIVCVLI